MRGAEQYPISKIFDSDDSKTSYNIPKYQREYAWDKGDWENLFNDLTDNDKGYFLGSVIMVNTSRDTLGSQTLEVIDGQQRLVTLSLFYAAIYSKLNEFATSKGTDSDFITEITNLKRRLLIKGTDAIKISPSKQKSNLLDYEFLIKDVIKPDSVERPSHLGNRRLSKAYLYFRNAIDSLDYDKLKDLLERINSAIIVKIETETNADAYVLFESLNNRGEPLSAIDLIKNSILATLEKNKKMTIDQAFDKWQIVINNLTDDLTIQERFLRQYYNAFKYKSEVKLDGFSKATRSNLIKIYDKLIYKNPEYLLEEFIEKSKIYNMFIAPNESKEIQSKYKGALVDLAHVGAAPSYTFLLYLFSTIKDDENLIEEVLEFFVKWHIRRNLTDLPPTRELDKLFIELISGCEEKRKTKLNSEFIIKYLTENNNMASLDAFKEKLNGNIYEENTDATRFILCKIEEQHFTKERRPDLWERNGKDYIFTIEHIFPEGENIPKPWIDMIADGNKEKAKELQEQYVHKIGNLTLSGYNSNLFNHPFIEKRDKKDNGEYVGYKNGFYLNIQLKDLEKWKIENIKNRSESLVNDALVIFKMEKE